MRSYLFNDKVNIVASGTTFVFSKKNIVYHPEVQAIVSFGRNKAIKQFTIETSLEKPREESLWISASIPYIRLTPKGEKTDISIRVMSKEKKL